jgi:hypothetical protein
MDMILPAGPWPSDRVSAKAGEHHCGLIHRNSDTLRPTGPPGSTAPPTAQPPTRRGRLARPIFEPGTKGQTISNQIVVPPSGTLVDGFYMFTKRGVSIAERDRP